MKKSLIIGVLLIVLGAAAVLLNRINYNTTEEIVDIGPIRVTQEKENSIPLSPILGVVAIGGGVVLVLFGSKT